VTGLLTAAELSGKLQAVAIVGAAVLLVIVLELVRQRRLMERYSLLWLFCAVVLLLLAIFSGLLEWFSSTIGVATPSNALFLVAFGFVILVLLHFSVTISRLADQTKVLAQKLALTERELREARDQAAQSSDHTQDG
jgi:hypothetical protein